MFKNQDHNLIHQISEISDSVWRIERHYLDEAKNCDACVNLWRTLHEDYEKHIELLSTELKRHLNE